MTHSLRDAQVQKLIEENQRLRDKLEEILCYYDPGEIEDDEAGNAELVMRNEAWDLIGLSQS